MLSPQLWVLNSIPLAKVRDYISDLWPVLVEDNDSGFLIR